MTPDLEGSTAFYGGLFGWAAQAIPGVEGYSIIKQRRALQRRHGAFARRPPPAWMPYFGHEDVDSLFENIAGAGRPRHQQVVQVPAGRFAVFADPQGAVFSALTGDYDE